MLNNLGQRQGAIRLKRAFVIFSSLLVNSLLFITGCGYSAPPATGTGATVANPNVSLILNRVFVTNQSTGVVQIVDATADTTKDAQTAVTGVTPTITVGALPRFMVVASTTKNTLVYNAGGNSLAIIDNTQETVLGSVTLPSFTESIVVSADGKTAYAAFPALGQVVTVDVANKALGTTVLSIPGARRLAIAHNGSKILVFGNGSDTFTVINTSDNTQAAAPAGFDRPFTAVFSSDDSKAFILNCGPECGGIAAGVGVLNIGANNVYTLSQSVAVPGGATVGIADTTNLYVAGSPNPGTLKGGMLSVINLSSPAVTSSVPISDGVHTSMALSSNNKVYVGARTCTTRDATNTAVSGCLSFFNISGTTATLSAPLGDVTSIQPIKGRNVVYVIEGGELQIYDTTADTLQPTQIDIVGTAVDVKQIDQ